MSYIGKMLDPKTVALIGATERKGAVGKTIMENGGDGTGPIISLVLWVP